MLLDLHAYTVECELFGPDPDVLAGLEGYGGLSRARRQLGVAEGLRARVLPGLAHTGVKVVAGSSGWRSTLGRAGVKVRCSKVAGGPPVHSGQAQPRARSASSQESL